MNRIERYNNLKKVIDEWDPIRLYEIGAPENEYDIEITKISSEIKLSNNIIEIAEVIYKVFIEMFDKNSFNKTISDCRKVAESLLEHENKLRQDQNQ